MSPAEQYTVATRSDFIDRLRVLLTALVIVHHGAITYGGSGGWFYREVSDASLPSSMLLTLLCAVDQAFFMGMFFLLAGYFTPGALARKGPMRFMAERGLRLGLPLLVFGFVLGPLTEALAGQARGEPWLPHWGALLAQGRFVLGPLWFAWALLLFTLVWLLRQQFGPPLRAREALPAPRCWWLSALAVGAAALLLRQAVPVGQERLGLQLGYFASYVFLFFLGCVAAPGRWLERIPAEQARRWRRIALLAIPLLPAALLTLRALTGQPQQTATGWAPAAWLYALWEPLVAWGLIAGLLQGFQQRFNTPSPRWQRWSAQAYGAFVLHAPVLVLVAVLMAPWGAPPLLKFLCVASMATVLSFLAARVLRAVPGVKRVL